MRSSIGCLNHEASGFVTDSGTFKLWHRTNSVVVQRLAHERNTLPVAAAFPVNEANAVLSRI